MMKLQNLGIQLTSDTNLLSIKLSILPQKPIERKKTKSASIKTCLDPYNQSFNKYVLSKFYMLITVLVPGDIAVN